MTGLYNRRGLQAALSSLRKEDFPLALCLFDLDNLKQVNDTYGHDAGDRFIEAFADIVRHKTRLDDIQCRYGGDEFLAFFPYATEANTDAYVKRVQERLEKENIQISMGVKLTDLDQEGTLDSYLSLAEQNMYENKQHRKEEKRNAIDKIK